VRDIGFALPGTIIDGETGFQDEMWVGFEDLAVPLLASAYTFACWLTRDSGEAEDLVQETFLKGLLGFASFRPGTNFRAWIFRILRNTFLSSRTKLERRMTVPFMSEDDSLELPTAPFDPESHLIHRSRIDSLRRAIDHLPMDYREIMVCNLEDVSYNEIAESLSIPLGTVMSRLARARRMVGENLRGDSNEA
jgi:RNA polymerase sigma-70 factor (ECF subfamily)